MTFTELKEALASCSELIFALPNGKLVPGHFHITELGSIHKKYIDCGGVVRHENFASFQLWFAQDYTHRLSVDKLLHILAEGDRLGIAPEDQVIVEYQTDVTIGKFHLVWENQIFRLIATETTCLAPDSCGIPAEKRKLSLKDLGNTCAPGSGCC